MHLIPADALLALDLAGIALAAALIWQTGRRWIAGRC